MMSPCRAPTAMRTPISRVRSFTETSMMFITPMPPTTSEITAIAEMSSVSVCDVDWIVSRIVSVFCSEKSTVPCRCVSSVSMADCASLTSASSAILTVIEDSQVALDVRHGRRMA